MDLPAPWVRKVYQLPSFHGYCLQIPQDQLPGEFKPLKLLLGLARTSPNWDLKPELKCFYQGDWQPDKRRWQSRAPETKAFSIYPLQEAHQDLGTLSQLAAGDLGLIYAPYSFKPQLEYQSLELSIDHLYPNSLPALADLMNLRLKELRTKEALPHLFEGGTFHLKRLDPLQIEIQKIQNDLYSSSVKGPKLMDTLSFGCINVESSRPKVELRTYASEFKQWNEANFFQLMDELCTGASLPKIKILSSFRLWAKALAYWSESRAKRPQIELGSLYELTYSVAILKALLEPKLSREIWLHCDEDLQVVVSDVTLAGS